MTLRTLSPPGTLDRLRREVGRLRPRRVARAVRSRLRTRAASWTYKKTLKDSRFNALYYALDGTFDREFQAVLHGRHAHSDARRTSDADARRDALAFTLRRNVHRLEKGLLMRPRRDVFAFDYIDETVNAYVRTVAESGVDTDLVVWAKDVLDEYFGVVGADDAIDQARTAYLDARTAGGRPSETVRRAPYQRETTTLRIGIDDMKAPAKRRRSVRWFEQRPVPRDVIANAMEVALQSPSACNRQPFVFRIFDEPELARRVSKFPMGTRGYDHNVPAVAVIVGRQRAYFSERDRHLIYVDGALAAMSFMYALEVQGVASCPINWPDIEKKERAMVELLGLEPDERPVMLVIFGYPDPDGMVAYSQKKSVEEACVFNVLVDE